METVNQKLNYQRERKLYNYAWNLATDKKGENFLFDYSKCTKKSLLPSPLIFPKDGCFAGPENYFQFFTSTKSKTLGIFLRIVHPTLEENETSGDSFEILYAYVDSYCQDPSVKLKRVFERCVANNSQAGRKSSPRQLTERVEFFRSSPPKNYVYAIEDKNSKWKVRWMYATLPENALVPPQRIIRLNFRINIQRNMWGEKCGSGCNFSILMDGDKMDTRDLLLSQDYSDFTILCGTKKYSAHRVVLASKSLVFKAMFSNVMRETKTGNVKIVDAESEIVEEFLRFIYTGEVQNLKKNAAGLFTIADKYDVGDLKMLTEHYLIEKITIMNVLEQYRLGKMLNSNSIVDSCVDTMKLQKADIWKTANDFAKDCETFPELYSAVFI